MNLFAVDFYFAPAAFEGSAVHEAEAAPLSGSPTTEPRSAEPKSATPRARTRVPNTVARFERSSKEPLDDTTIRLLATALIEDHGSTVVVEGHSDTHGLDDRAISLERAKWVKARLVSLGVSNERIETVGLGATGSPTDEPDGAVDDRVDVRWVDPEARGNEGK